MTTPLVYVGYDLREHAAYVVCKGSLRGTEVVPLNTRQLRRDETFVRKWVIDERGRMWDGADGRPFSTEFSHSRFLTPYIAKRDYPTAKWALFCDCDFMFRRDVSELFSLADDTKAVMVVKHIYDRTTTDIKMDSQIQSPYFRKLWSSMVLWNLDHPSNHMLVNSTQAANVAQGAYLHAFSWLTDDEIGSLPDEWNYIPGHSDLNVDPAAVHWSLGGPWMQGFEDEPFADEWRANLKKAVGDEPQTLFPLL